MAKQRLSISEARRQLARLVTGVNRAGLTVTITQHGRERAALIGINKYQELSEKAQAFERAQPKTTPFTVKGSLELSCSLQELEDTMQRIRRTWAEAVHRSSTELARELTHQ
ncbi:MAG TPA: type II toxin-antitoxin system Phd/YefM family antitoxin [Nitrososphaera sp.]|nr:type II toxin-antitoxin system Phd/YefM family antitoxin [Nitrososphaera sp.]